MSHKTFIQALAATIEVVAVPPASPVNGFTIEEHGNHVYKVEGECWTFYLKFDPSDSTWDAYAG